MAHQKQIPMDAMKDDYNNVNLQIIENKNCFTSLSYRSPNTTPLKLSALNTQTSPNSQTQQDHESNSLSNHPLKFTESERLLSDELTISPNILYQTTILSFWVNICLLGAKIYISFISSSMAIIACTIDSLMDVLSGTLILITQKIISQKQINRFDQKYPAGRSLLEPVCTIVYATIMGSVSVQLCAFCIQQSFLKRSIQPSIDPSILFVLFFTVLIKLILWVFCILLSKRRGDHLFVLTNDHKSDVITNTIAFLVSGAIFFNKNLRLVDNLGALIIAGFASLTWIFSNKSQIRILSGYKADPQFYFHIATIISQFPEIMVDDIKAYHFGVKYMVELAIIMDPSTTVRDYVKIEKQLQRSIKRLPMVQQCFISIDYQRRFLSLNQCNNPKIYQRKSN